MICNNCTARIPDRSIVCPACGAPVKNRRPQSQDVQSGNPIERNNLYSSQVNNEQQNRAPQQYGRMPQQNNMVGVNNGRNQTPPMRGPQEMPMSAYGQTQRQPVHNTYEEEQKMMYGTPNSDSYPYHNQARPNMNAPVQKSPNTYQPPVFPELEEEDEAEIVPPCSVGAFFWTTLLYAVPVIGFIFYLVWAFSKKTNPSRRNYCRAILLLTLITVLIISVALIVLYTVFDINYVEEIQSYFNL